MSKVLRFTLAPMILLAFCLTDLYPHPERPKRAEIHGHPDKREEYHSRSVYQYYYKDCPECHGRITGRTYKEKYKCKVRWNRFQWEDRRNRWKDLPRTRWYKLPDEYKYPSTTHWDTICSYGRLDCDYGYYDAYLNKPSVYFAGGYHV